MARQDQSQQRKSKLTCKKCVAVGAVLILWIALLISPLGRVVAAVTIFGLIMILFVLGCIHVPEDDFRR